MALREIADRAYNRKNYADAIAMSEQAAAIAVEIDDHRLAADCRLNQAYATYQNGQVAETEQTYALALEEFRAIGDQYNMGETLCRMADIAGELRNYEMVLAHATDAQHLGVAEDNWWIIAYSAYYMGRGNYFLDHEELALENLERSRHFFRKRGDLVKVAMVDDFAATVQSYLGREHEAVNLLRSCVYIADATQDKSDDPYALRRLGNSLSRIGRYEEALDYLTRSMNEYQSRNQHRTYAFVAKEIADNLGMNDQHQEALAQYERAQSLLDSLGEDHAVRHCKMRRSQLLHDHGDFSQAERLARQVYLDVVSNEEFDDQSYIYWVGLHLADNLLELEKFQALLDLTAELDESRAEPSPSNLVWKKTMRARALNALGHSQEALAEVEAALSLTTDEILNATTAYLYEIRAHIQLEQGKKSGERDLAHAIAIHLAAGSDDEARDLANYFMPKLNPEVDLGLGMTDAETSAQRVEEGHSATGSYQVGFHPTD